MPHIALKLFVASLKSSNFVLKTKTIKKRFRAENASVFFFFFLRGCGCPGWADSSVQYSTVWFVLARFSAQLGIVGYARDVWFTCCHQISQLILTKCVLKIFSRGKFRVGESSALKPDSIAAITWLENDLNTNVKSINLFVLHSIWLISVEVSVGRELEMHKNCSINWRHDQKGTRELNLHNKLWLAL